MIRIILIDVTQEGLEEKEAIMQRYLKNYPIEYSLKAYLIDDFKKVAKKTVADLMVIHYDVDPADIRLFAVYQEMKWHQCYFIFYELNPRFTKENPTTSLVRIFNKGCFDVQFEESFPTFLSLYSPLDYFLYTHFGHLHVYLKKEIIRLHKDRLTHRCSMITNQGSIHIDDLEESDFKEKLSEKEWGIVSEYDIINLEAILDIKGYRIHMKDGAIIPVNAFTRNIISKNWKAKSLNTDQ